MKIILAFLVLSAIISVATSVTTDNNCSCEPFSGLKYDEASNTCKEPTTPIKNCIEYQSYGSELKCRYCDYGYVKDSTSKNCNTEGTLDNCWYVKDDDGTKKCSFCEEGYYISSTGACKVNPGTISNCLEYSQNDTTIECDKCEEQYRLKGRNQCVAFDIDYCIDYEYSDESRCSTCEEGYYVSEDYKSCKVNPTNISGCVKYSESSGSVKCTRCDASDNKGLKDEACSDIGSVSVEGCGKYRYDDASSKFYCSACAVDSKYTSEFTTFYEVKSCIDCPWFEESNEVSVLKFTFAIFTFVALLF